MIQRLFLNRIYTEAAGSPVGGQDDLILPPFAHEAEALLPLLELTEAGAEVALNAAILQLMPVLGWKLVCQTHCGANEVSAIAGNLSIDIAALGDGSHVFGRGGEQPPSTTVALRRQVAIAQ
jgi:hypothetical protein